MAVVVSVIVLAALLLVFAVIVHVVQKTVRWLASAATTRTTRPAQPPVGLSHRPSSTPPAYGHLPTPADPVGALGSLSPDADMSSSMNERDLLGE